MHLKHAEVAAQQLTYTHDPTQVWMEFTNLRLSDEKHAFWLVLGLAIFDQITASTAIINYTPQILSSMGETDQDAVMLNVLMGLTKLVGVSIGMATVDTVRANWQQLQGQG